MKACKGMTLLEVLVALTIFATASLSLVRAVSQHTNTLRHLEDKTFASMVADNQMALTLLDGVPASKKKGKTQMAGRTWYWKVTPVPTVAEFITAFDVSVSAEPEANNPMLTVRSYASK